MHVYVVIGTRLNFPYTKYGGYERPHKSGKRSHPSVKKFSTAEFQIDLAILAAIGHRFIVKK